MLEIINQTPFADEKAVLYDMKGEEHWVVFLKGTFDIKNNEVRIAEEQMPIVLSPEFYGEPGLSSQKYETDIEFKKHGTDVIVNGNAYGPKGRKTQQIVVRLRIGPIDKRLVVTGDRIWKRGLMSIQPSRATAFDKMPIVYERAYGGIDKSDKEKQYYDPSNPVGVGFCRNKKNLIGSPCPNVEDPRRLVNSTNHRGRTAGYGVISKHWEPRLNWRGTCDQKWQMERMPLYPEDCDPRFFQAAPVDQVISSYLKGKETVALDNLSPDGLLFFQLPKLSIGFQTLIANEIYNHRPELDTLIIEPDYPRVMLIWRTRISCHRKKLKVQWTRIFEKEIV